MSTVLVLFKVERQTTTIKLDFLSLSIFLLFLFRQFQYKQKLLKITGNSYNKVILHLLKASQETGDYF